MFGLTRKRGINLVPMNDGERSISFEIHAPGRGIVAAIDRLRT